MFFFAILTVYIFWIEYPPIGWIIPESVANFELHPYLRNMISLIGAYGVTGITVTIYVVLCFRGLHVLELVSSQFFMGHSSFSTLTQSSKSILFIMPATIFTIFTVGLEECDETLDRKPGYMQYELLAVCQLFLTNNNALPSDDTIPTSKLTQQWISSVLTQFLPVVALLIYGIIGFVSGYWPRLANIILRMKQMIQAERFEFEITEKVIDKAVMMMREGLFDTLDNRYFDMSESRRESIADESYRGPTDEYYSRPDDLSSFKVSDTQLTPYASRKKLTEKKVEKVEELARSLKRSADTSMMANYELSARPTRRTTFLGFQTSVFDQVDQPDGSSKNARSFAPIQEARLTLEERLEERNV